MKYPWEQEDQKHFIWTNTDKRNWIRAFKAGRDAQRLSDAKICQDQIDSKALNPIEKYRAGFIRQVIENNTGDL